MAAKQDFTIGAVFRSLAPDVRPDRWNAISDWPPDAFAIAGYILQISGAYRVVIANEFWPKPPSGHPSSLVALGVKWRSCAARFKTAPAEIRRKWERILKAQNVPLTRVVDDAKLTGALLDIVGAADAASEGIGLPQPFVRPEDADYLFYRRAEPRLGLQADANEPSSLCEQVASSVVCVLPKLHTPQAGLTFRALSHHLALCLTDEVRPIWSPIPSALSEHDEERFNLLVVPLPYEVDPRNFVAQTERRSGRSQMPEKYQLFGYRVPDNMEWLETQFPKLLAEALQEAPERKIHGVVFPELSLASEEEFACAFKHVNAMAPDAFLVAGVCAPGEHVGRVQNTVKYAVPLAGGAETKAVLWTQSKHHRWKVDAPQIHQYQLGTQLKTGHAWWEDIEVPCRELNFFALKRWLTCCFLICEDLARQEPVARLVRAVGPNLLIALLFDGPQLGQRWPSRYAAVLGDDPGCSVLTVTNAGMPKRSLPPVGTPKEIADRNARCIGLWKDASQTHEILLGDDSVGVILSLSRAKGMIEYSADGRQYTDAGHLTLASSADIKQVVIAGAV